MPLIGRLRQTNIISKLLFRNVSDGYQVVDGSLKLHDLISMTICNEPKARGQRLFLYFYQH